VLASRGEGDDELLMPVAVSAAIGAGAAIGLLALSTRKSFPEPSTGTTYASIALFAGLASVIRFAPVAIGVGVMASLTAFLAVAGVTSYMRTRGEGQSSNNPAG
jgi:hypothetical protein